MSIRGRASSDLPAHGAGALAERVGVRAQNITGQSSQAQSRRSGPGALLAYATGVGIGAGMAYYDPVWATSPCPRRGQ